ncbi:MAG TPA: tyrosine-type recombinase/integrase [Clostridiales bacterium]|nr:tyrosine-type recombinase/integrase [Clostridiales bacterium]
MALRISDLLELTWRDVLKENKDFKVIEIKEGKYQKQRKIKLNRSAQKAQGELLESLDTYDYIFQSREGDNKSITRQQALNILKDAAAAIGVEERFGTHALRKAWGHHDWKKGFNPALIMETLNHNNLNVTKRCLGNTARILFILMDLMEQIKAVVPKSNY